MDLLSILQTHSEVQVNYLCEISLLKFIRFWTADPSSPASSYETPFPFDGNAYITNVNYQGQPLILAASAADVLTTPGSYYWDRSILYIQTANGDDPRVKNNTVTVEITYYFSALGGKIFNDIYYQPLLLEIPMSSMSNNLDFSGVGQIANGSVLFDNSSGFFDDLTNLDWQGGTCRILLGADLPQFEQYMEYADYKNIQTWLNDNWTKTNQQFVMNLLELKQNITTNIPQRIYNTDDYPNVMANSVGAVIPLAYGQIFGAAPTCIDTVNGIFKVADHAIFSIDEVRVATSTGWVVVPFEGDLPNGQFTLTVEILDSNGDVVSPGSWDGQSNVSVDFHGRLNANGSWMDNASDIMADLLSVQMGQGPLDPVSFTASKTALVYGGYSAAQQDGASLVIPDRNNSYVQSAYNSKLDAITGDFTFEAWIYQTTSNTATGNQGILGRDNFASLNGPFNIAFVSATNYPVVSLNGAAYQLYSTIPVAVNAWTHVAATRSGSTVSLWLNGQLAAQGTYGTALSYSGEPFHAGSWYVDFYCFLGYINEVRLSNVSRYNAPFVPVNVYGSDFNTLLYWRLNEGTGTTATDSSASGINGTLHGDATWITRQLGLTVSERVPSLYLDTAKAGTDVIQIINQLVGSYLFVDMNGVYHYVVFQPVAGEGLTIFDDTSILNFQKDNPTMQNQSEIDALFAYRLSDGWGEALIVTSDETQYRSGFAQPSTLGSQTIQYATLQDAAYYAERQLVFYGTKPDVYTISLPWSILLLLPGDYVIIQYSRHNLNAVFEIMQITNNGNGLDNYSTGQSGGGGVAGSVASSGSSSSGLQLSLSNLHNFNNQTGFWVGDEGASDGSGDLPTRFANLTGYGSRGDGQPDGSLVWNDSWDPAIKSWVAQNVGYWDDDNGFVETADVTSEGISVWF